jgi:hypothetical protein
VATFIIEGVITSRWRVPVQLFRHHQLFRWAMLLCYFASVVLIAGALWRWGAVEVPGQIGEVALLTLVGTIWLLVSLNLARWLGVGVADDAIERRTPSALIALWCATFGLAPIYAGGNLGEGPSYWSNIFSATLATIRFFALPPLLDLGGGVSASLAEERDFASGLRFGGFLVAVGLILGRAVAGNWHSGIGDYA